MELVHGELKSRYSLPLYLLSKIVNSDYKNDGMVNIHSCNILVSYFNNHYNNNYLSKVNHADFSCRNGDCYYGNSCHPCSYYIDKI